MLGALLAIESRQKRHLTRNRTQRLPPGGFFLTSVG